MAPLIPAWPADLLMVALMLMLQIHMHTYMYKVSFIPRMHNNIIHTIIVNEEAFGAHAIYALALGAYMYVIMAWQPQ